VVTQARERHATKMKDHQREHAMGEQRMAVTGVAVGGMAGD
jgi:hypothetical protein